jgi:MFS family permease
LGWRAAYITLAIPIVVVCIPMVLLLVRSHPPGVVRMSVAQGADVREGFEAIEAIHTRSFWLIVIANFCFAFTAAGALIHMVAYLLGVGYKPSIAALAMSLIFGFGMLGKLIMGDLADRMTARKALALNFAIQCAGLALAFAVVSGGMIFLFVPVYGLTFAAPMMLVPLVIAESLGLKRYGILSALTGLSQTSGMIVGPVVAGHIYDVTQAILQLSSCLSVY